jgi:hypothetical protein
LRLRNQRLLALTSGLLWTLAVLVLLLLRSGLAHSYRHWLAPGEIALPRPTHSFALPLLGAGQSLEAHGWGWGDAVWVLLPALPLAAALWAARAPTAATVALRWHGFQALYAPLLAAFLLALAYALWLPFALM